MNRLKHILIAGLLILLIVSCEGLMRDAEAPRRPSEDHFIPPTNPGLVFTNLENAFYYREYDIYGRCFSDSSTSGKIYRFDPALVKAVSFPPQWNVQNEESYFQGLIAACPSDSLLLLSITNDDIPDSDDGDSVSYQINYNLIANHTRQGIDRVFRGRSYIKLVRNNQNYWVIYYWQDIPVSTDATWSDLKAYF
ncbi:MAG: hypothetical protein KAT14_02775 [Candidatus Marinimicrobia bacterium]|nr:hypothetical protein [Candidatus Neomarinimicrobiota bacterium]